jgi:arylsulfatase A-like enzyme
MPALSRGGTQSATTGRGFMADTLIAARMEFMNTRIHPALGFPATSCTFLLAVAGLALSTGGLTAAAQRPNVLVVLSDDQGWGDVSFNGNTNLRTPHIDSLARDGASFERFYVSPVCSPTRAEFLTGRYHPRSGVRGVTTGGERMDLDEVTIADMFKAAGYATANFGKWHNGTQYPYHPNGRGFDEFYGFTSGHWGDYFSPPLDHNGRIVRGNGYTTDDFSERAMQFIEQHRAQPFFAYVTYNTPHSPMQVPDRWWSKFRDKDVSLRGTQPDRENLDHTRAAMAMCENIDWNVGRILKNLDELELARDTIVVYFCDNGPNGDRWNGGMKGIKGSTDEGGVRSPLLVRWPGKVAAGKRIPQVAAAIDLLPTLAALADIPLLNTKPLDGISLKPLLVAPSSEVPPELSNRVIFSHWNGRVSAATGRIRIDHTGKLYDVVQDPGQRTDISPQHPHIKSRLTAAVQAWKDNVFADAPHDPRPFLVGHFDSRFTQLPARDGVGHGNIKRSSRHPNCSYFTNWTSTDDRITWDVDVVVGGKFEAEIYYTCSASDVGSTIELSINGSAARGKIAEPHDPPLRGAEKDRVRRQESYVKDFRPMTLGTIRLQNGPGELTLRALQIPSSQVMDFRLLTLKRVDD